MAIVAVLVFVFVLQGSLAAQQVSTSLQEFEWQASSVVHEARTQMAVLVNQLMTNATIITQIAEGNASLLLANLYNEINRGIAEAQVKASQIGTTFQIKLGKSVEKAMRQAGQIYTRVESSLRNSTNYIEETVVQLLNNTEEQLTKVVDTARASLVDETSTVKTKG